MSFRRRPHFFSFYNVSTLEVWTVNFSKLTCRYKIHLFPSLLRSVLFSEQWRLSLTSTNSSACRRSTLHPLLRHRAAASEFRPNLSEGRGWSPISRGRWGVSERWRATTSGARRRRRRHTAEEWRWRRNRRRRKRKRRSWRRLWWIRFMARILDWKQRVKREQRSLNSSLS